jgi:hypothetical protein
MHSRRGVASRLHGVIICQYKVLLHWQRRDTCSKLSASSLTALTQFSPF